MMDWMGKLLRCVSIAEAILWGEQRKRGGVFPQRGDHVSIAEAILWGEQQMSVAVPKGGKIVSIAEAILWGEQRRVAE